LRYRPTYADGSIAIRKNPAAAHLLSRKSVKENN
jgi:hypothetical protein